MGQGRREKRGWSLAICVTLLRPLLTLLTRRSFRGMEHLPRGGFVFAANHISHADPLLFSHFVNDAGYSPHFLAKASVLNVPVLGRFLRSTGQIPVQRGGTEAAQAYRDAVLAIGRGASVIVYPEGTITRDADLWPMVGKTGVARIALETGCPVIPCAQWGAHELLPPYAKRPRLLPRKVNRVQAGPPVDLTDLQDKPLTTEVLRQATDRVMQAISVQLGEVRGETPPLERFDPRKRGVASTGNPNRPEAQAPEGRRAAVTHVAVMGAGSWGTAFSLVLADAGNEVRLWGRRAELCDAINATQENPEYLPGVVLPGSVTADPDPAKVLDGADVVVLAVPSQKLRENLGAWVDLLMQDAVLLSLMKGVELGTARRMSEVISEVTGAGTERVAVLSGPNLAKEIAARQPAASVVACVDEDVAIRLQKLCHTATFRPYTNTDVVGCELGGATKNVIALAVGMASGLGFGDNAKASVITRGLAETGRLAAAAGADPMTMAGLAGLGDLVATCSSPLSRNRGFGEKLGRGMSVDEVVASTRQVAEGVRSCESLRELAARHRVEMPIVEHVSALVRGETTPEEMVRSLISRAAKAER